MKRVYICYPIDSSGSRHTNKDHAYKYAAQLINEGLHPIIPHLWIDFDEQSFVNYSQSTYLTMDFDDIRTCDAILAPMQSNDSYDCKMECMVAQALNIPIFESVAEILKWTEANHVG